MRIIEILDENYNVVGQVTVSKECVEYLKKKRGFKFRVIGIGKSYW